MALPFRRYFFGFFLLREGCRVHFGENSYCSKCREQVN
jgi:hypothetical protein